MSRPELEMPPQDVEAERALLGCLCLSDTALLEVQEIVRAEQFYIEAHRLVFDALVAMDTDGIRPDAITLRACLETMGELERVGGDEVLIAILDAVPHAQHARHYAGVIRDRWQERELRRLCREVSQRNGNTTIGERIGELESGCQYILEATTDGRAATMSDAMMALSDRWAKDDGIGQPTGFEKLDKLLGGLRPGTVNVIAARPGMGKSSLAGCIANHFLRCNLPVVFSSLELSQAEIAQRFLSLASGVTFGKLDSDSRLDEIEREMVLAAMTDASALPLTIDDTPAQAVRHIAATMRLAKKRAGLALGVIDYLQLIQPADRSVIREQQVAQMSQSLKVMARELKIPLLLLAQLNREVENRDSGKPRLRDLRESGSIEQDADSVLFIYQPDADDDTRRDVVVAKNRHGPTGQVSLEWQGRLMRFRDMQEVPEDVANGFEEG